MARRSFTANDVLETFFDDQSSSNKIVVKLTYKKLTPPRPFSRPNLKKKCKLIKFPKKILK